MQQKVMAVLAALFVASTAATVAAQSGTESGYSREPTNGATCEGEAVAVIIDVSKASLQPDNQDNPYVFPTVGNSCWFTVTLSAASEPELNLNETCSFEVYGRVHSPGSTEVYFEPTGDCEGVVIESAQHPSPVSNDAASGVPSGGTVRPGDINDVPPTAVDAPIADPEAYDELSTSAAAVGERAARQSRAITGWQHAKVIGWDVIDIVMFWNYTNSRHEYNGSTVTWGDGQYAYWTDDWWYKQSWLYGFQFTQSNTRIESYNYTSLHSDGFPTSLQPDTHAYVQPSVWGSQTGAQWCTFLKQFLNPYPEFGWSTACIDLS